MTETTTPTPPEGLTDEQLFKLAADALGYVSITHSDEDLPGAYEASGLELLAAMRAAIAAHEAARAQLPPNYIDDGHTGEDRELLEAFYVASRAEGGTADEIVLRGIRAAIAADRADRPAPAPAADVAQVLAGAGVFKGSHGLRGLLDADTFWEQQPYGTRLCYGDGIADYLQRGVLRCAVTLLEQFSLGGWVVPTVEQVIPTPEEIEAQFRAWWKASYPNAPAGGHAVRSHVAFGQHLLGREVQ
jgi:hypothetical protein